MSATWGCTAAERMPTAQIQREATHARVLAAHLNLAWCALVGGWMAWLEREGTVSGKFCTQNVCVNLEIIALDQAGKLIILGRLMLGLRIWNDPGFLHLEVSGRNPFLLFTIQWSWDHRWLFLTMQLISQLEMLIPGAAGKTFTGQAGREGVWGLLTFSAAVKNFQILLLKVHISWSELELQLSYFCFKMFTKGHLMLLKTSHHQHPTKEAGLILTMKPKSGFHRSVPSCLPLSASKNIMKNENPTRTWSV